MVKAPQQPAREQITIHGHRTSFLTAGQGEPVVLIHGITGSARNWEAAMALIAAGHKLIAPDLLGHGLSAKPRGDYSLGAYASGIRDLIAALGHDKVTIVGHSLGGGIAMQFAYQFPERCSRMVLVSSGGLGQEVHLMLRAATLPGAELVLPVISNSHVSAAGEAVGGLLGKLGLRPGPDMTEIARGWGSLADGDTRRAFLHTIRSVIDPTGQRVDATDRLYMAHDMPALVVWGERDRVIPVAHAHVAHQGMPGSRLEVFEDSGHFPQLDDPVRFASVLEQFVDSTEPAKLDAESLRERVRSHDAAA